MFFDSDGSRRPREHGWNGSTSVEVTQVMGLEFIAVTFDGFGA